MDTLGANAFSALFDSSAAIGAALSAGATATIPPAADRSKSSRAAVPSRNDRAYVATASDEIGGIVFARTLKQARRVGAERYTDGVVSQIICYRAPWADWCAPSGIVHASLLVEHGWTLQCRGCANDITLEWLTESELEPMDVIGIQDGDVFCCAACKSLS